MYSNRGKLKLQGKTSSHRKALIKSQVIELIRNSKIKTTPPRAKVLKSEFDKLVTKAKLETDHSKRQIESFFGNNERAVERLYQVVKENLSDRTSGYTRVIKTLPRKGDNAPQSYVMLVNYAPKEKKSRIQEVLEKQEIKVKKPKVKSVKKTEKKEAKKTESKAKKTNKK